MGFLKYILLALPVLCCAQEGRGDLRFVFYNVENLFDPFNDSLVQDEEFISGGAKGWSWEKFLEKQNRISKVIAATGGWDPPEFIGLCEVENRFVLNWLTRRTPLLKYNYRIIHHDSPDERGMDVAMLYLPGAFNPLKRSWHRVLLPGVEDQTREILYVMGTVRSLDTVHFLICHWPSRWEGYLESLSARLAAAAVVRSLLDSIWSADPRARIILGGDLNDEFHDPGLSRILRLRCCDDDPEGRNLYDTCLYYSGPLIRDQGPSGTLKYRGIWYEFDHILVSGGFLRDTVLCVRIPWKRVFSVPFLLEKDPYLPGKRPFRTYDGYRYRGGFSDHLPVIIDLWDHSSGPQSGIGMEK